MRKITGTLTALLVTLAANPTVLQLERDKVMAEASAKLLSNCRQNCFIGGDAFTRNLLQNNPRDR